MAWGEDYDKITSMVQLAEVDEAKAEFAEDDEDGDFEIPEIPTVDGLKAKAAKITPEEIKKGFTALRAILDDPDENINPEMRTQLEQLYSEGKAKMEGGSTEEAPVEAAAEGVVEFHPGHPDQSVHGKGGSAARGTRVSRLGRKSDDLNQHADTPKKAMQKSRKASRSASNWAAVALIGLAAAALFPASTLGAVGLGVGIGSVAAVGTRVRQARKHRDQANKLRNENTDMPIGAAAAGSVVLASAEFDMDYADAKMKHLKMLFEHLEMAYDSLEDQNYEDAILHVKTAKVMVKKALIGYMGERKMDEDEPMPMPAPAMQIEIDEEEFAGLPPALAKKVVANLEKKLASEKDPKKKAEIQAKIDKFTP